MRKAISILGCIGCFLLGAEEVAAAVPTQKVVTVTMEVPCSECIWDGIFGEGAECHLPTGGYRIRSHWR